MQSNIKIGFDPIEGIYVEVPDGLRTTRKYIDLNDLRDILVRDIELQTPLLPTGCKFYAEQGNKQFVIIEVPSIKRTIMYHGRSSGSVTQHIVPLPYTLFGFVVTSGTITLSKCICSITPVMDDSTELYNFPLGNVYDSLKICWGNTNIPSIRNPIQLSGIPNLFYTAPFNGDLYSSAGRSINVDQGLSSLIDELVESDIFPHNKLVSWGTFLQFKNSILSS